MLFVAPIVPVAYLYCLQCTYNYSKNFLYLYKEIILSTLAEYVKFKDIEAKND